MSDNSRSSAMSGIPRTPAHQTALSSRYAPYPSPNSTRGTHMPPTPQSQFTGRSSSNVNQNNENIDPYLINLDANHRGLRGLRSERSLDDEPLSSVPGVVAHTLHRLPPQRVDELLDTLFDVDEEDDRRRIREFNEMDSMPEKLLLLSIQITNLNRGVLVAFEEIKEILADIKLIKELIKRAWGPSEAQLKLIKLLIRHYLISPIVSYNFVARRVQEYISINASTIRLGLYNTDATVRVTVDELISYHTNQLKNGYRKAILAGIGRGVRRGPTPLMDWSRGIVQAYHMPDVPNEVPRPMLARFALLRHAAERLPVAEGGNSDRLDTGFWSAVETELDGLYGADGPAASGRGSAAMIQWEDDIINADNRRYHPAALLPAPTDHDGGIVGGSTAILPLPADANPLAGYVPGASGTLGAPGAMDGDLDMENLGGGALPTPV